MLGRMSKSEPERIQLRNRYLELSVIPEAGGKIIDLIDRRSGRNWLWQNPHIPVTAARRDASFNREQDSGGWDEILLSLRPAEVDVATGAGLRVPDHGDLIGSEWTVDKLNVTSGVDTSTSSGFNWSAIVIVLMLTGLYATWW